MANHEKMLCALMDCGTMDVSPMFDDMEDDIFADAVDSSRSEELDISADAVLHEAFLIALARLSLSEQDFEIYINCSDSSIVYAGPVGCKADSNEQSEWEEACQSFEDMTGFCITNAEDRYVMED